MEMERFLEGDSKYLDELSQRYAPLLESVIRPYAQDGDHAEDLVQEVWINVYRFRQTYEGRGPFESWLHRVAIRVCLVDHRRCTALERGLVRFRRLWRAEGPRSPDQLLAQEELHARLHEALGALAVRQVEAITLRKLEGKSTEEVAAVMGIEKATVRSLIRNGIERLRTCLERDDALP